MGISRFNTTIINYVRTKNKYLENQQAIEDLAED